MESWEAEGRTRKIDALVDGACFGVGVGIVLANVDWGGYSLTRVTPLTVLPIVGYWLLSLAVFGALAAAIRATRSRSQGGGPSPSPPPGSEAWIRELFVAVGILVAAVAVPLIAVTLVRSIFTSKGLVLWLTLMTCSLFCIGIFMSYPSRYPTFDTKLSFWCGITGVGVTIVAAFQAVG